MHSRLDFPGIRYELEEVILPFWLERSLDHDHGGFLTCFDNYGRDLTSTDKFSWAQGRLIWVLAAAAELSLAGDLDFDGEMLIEHAIGGARFVTENMVRDDSSCVFLTSRDGVPSDAGGESIYADCFVAMGLFRLAKATAERHWFEIAAAIVSQAAAKVESENPPTDPYPIPSGFASFGPRMIILATRLAETRASAVIEPQQRISTHALVDARAAVLAFRQDDGTFIDLRPMSSDDDDTLLARHRTPGHALEGIWMALEASHAIGDREQTDELVASAKIIIDKAVDPIYGGIYRYMDCDGGIPTGRLVGAPYEALIQRTWSTKLWWVHSEAVYTAALCAHERSDPLLAESAVELWDYSRRVFSTNRSAGEWVQIHDREGNVLNEVVGLPVKDPYHVARDLMQLIQLGNRVSPEVIE
jgi:N-acylglucosamine 2-epimerase